MAISVAAICSAAFFISTTIIVCFCAYCESARIVFLKCIRYFLQRNCCCYKVSEGTKFAHSATNALKGLNYSAMHSPQIYSQNVAPRHYPYMNYRLDHQIGTCYYPNRWWSPEIVKGPRGVRCNCFWNYRVNPYWSGVHKSNPIVTYPPSPCIPVEPSQNNGYEEILYADFDGSDKKQDRGSEVYYVISIV
ncbi:hypothetical protein DdX_05217 [Ditylenchus destructor]|uniref:Uncharacterized protein n=1 Tax=Ditylenchus destructor TaxID=166010 RepID=A0AAD4NAZ2_9BILA|nr:hypothetical protein DdX_05217 [Ditylenchus destructor]